MGEDNPFANWPHLDAPQRRGAEPRGPLPERNDPVSKNNALENFLGGSPGAVFVKLMFVSLVVGALLMWLDIRPDSIWRGVVDFTKRIYALGFGAVHELISYILAGAAIVVPAWFLLRLFSAGGRR